MPLREGRSVNRAVRALRGNHGRYAASAPLAARPLIAGGALGTAGVIAVLLFSASSHADVSSSAVGSTVAAGRPSAMRFVPWFILGFLALAGLRSGGVIPPELAGPLGWLAKVLTIVSMAALGLGVDLRVLRAVGGRVTAAVTLSLLMLIGISLGLVHILRIA